MALAHGLELLAGAAALAIALGSGQRLAQTPATLYSFCSQLNCTDGGSPSGQLMQAANGDLYGTTGGGGAHGYGTIFRITAGGALTTLHDFCAPPNCTDGASSVLGMAPLVQATNGDLYGTTFGGSACTSVGDVKNYGTIISLRPANTVEREIYYEHTSG
jgi:uncharacterized repeat protein (TIGR03803 family)